MHQLVDFYFFISVKSKWNFFDVIFFGLHFVICVLGRERSAFPPPDFDFCIQHRNSIDNFAQELLLKRQNLF